MLFRSVPTRLTFVDIAGLVRGASKGEGLGNQFLAHIREVDAIVHVVRCFENGDVTHVEGRIDPIADIETVETELMLADLDSLERRGLIERREDESDRRARGIHLTQAGHDLAVRVAKVGTEIQLRLLASVPPEDLQTCQRVLAQIEHKLDEEPIEETSKRRNR